jgi:hypothetical protein
MDGIPDPLPVPGDAAQHAALLFYQHIVGITAIQAYPPSHPAVGNSQDALRRFRPFRMESTERDLSPDGVLQIETVLMDHQGTVSRLDLNIRKPEQLVWIGAVPVGAEKPIRRPRLKSPDSQ